MARKGIVENVGGFLGDVASGVGDFVGGVGEHIGTGLTAVRDAERAKLAAPGVRNQASEVSQLLQTYRSIDPSQTAQRDQVLQRIMQTPTFQKFSGTVGPLVQSQVDKSRATKKISELARAGSASDDFVSPELRTAIGKKITQSFADIGITPEVSNEVSGSQRVRLASLFSENLKSLKKSSKGNLATKEETQVFADKFKVDAARAGASPTAAAALFGELHDVEVGKRGAFRNDVLPKGSKASTFFPSEAPAGDKPKGKPKATTDETLRAFEDFVQVGTEDFPEDNVRKTRASIGITEPADQQTMQELEQAAPPKMDVQAIAQQDPEAFKQMMSALRKGKTPSGKKFTIKDALEMMGQL